MPENLFATAPKEVVSYFDRRPSVPTFDWRDLAPHEHALAHTVAKTAGFEILGDLRKAIRKAVVDRQPFDEFRDELMPLLRQKGWWGIKRATDPKTGEPVLAQLGSLRRLQIIHWANVYSAHAAGEWQRVQQNREFLPWLTYVPSVSERKRPLHISWYGTTLRIDDPWWRSHYPPNGWNCKCSVRQIGDREAARLHNEFGRDKAPPLDERPWKNKRTGQTEMIPAGIDPGWQTNSGMLRDRFLTRQLQGSLDEMPAQARAIAVRDLTKHPVVDEVFRRDVNSEFSVVIGQMRSAVQQAIGSKTSILRLSGGSARHAMEHPEISPDVLKRASELMDAEAFVDERTAIFFGSLDGELYRLVVRRTLSGGEAFIVTMHRAEQRHLERARMRHEAVRE